MTGISLLLQAGGGGGWMPPEASTTAPEVDFVFNFILGISVFFFALIIGLMVLFIIRYRRRKGRETGDAAANRNLGVELVWTAIPLLVVIAIFWVGFRAFMDMITPPEDAYEINVVAQKWQWLFEYPGGWVDDELHVPVDRPIRLVMRSEDVIHSFYVPAFRVKQDVVPGRYTKTWFEPTKTGEFAVRCAEYCGTGHSDMVSRVIVHEPGGYEKWLKDASNILSPLLRVGDLSDPAAIATAIREAKTPLTAFLRDGLTEATRNLLQAWDGTSDLSDDQLRALVDDLNAILKGPCIHTPERFEGIELSEETKARLEKNPEGEALIELNRWLLSEAFPAAVTRGPDLVDAGQWIYEKKGGCRSCHTIDGSAGTGPSFLGLFGSTQRFEGGGRAVADENYIRESILSPNAKVVQGYQAVMPTMKGRLSDREIDALIAFFKSLSK